MQRMLIGLMVGAVAVSVAGCGRGGEGASPGSAGSTAAQVVIARPADVVTLDPAAAGDNESIWTSQLLYSTLYRASADGKTVMPDLAKTTSTSPDGLITTITLQPDAVFSNGNKITSADVKFSLERNFATDAAWNFLYPLVKSVQAPNSTTVVITTKKPMAAFQSSFSLFATAILPKDFEGKSAAAFFASPVSSGPYVLASWAKGSQMVLRANPKWTGTPMKAKQLTFTVVPDDNTRVLQLRGGQVDAVEAPPASQMTSLGTADVGAKSFPSTYMVNLNLNQAKKPLADANVRKAIMEAIDRQSILKAAFFGSGRLAGAFLTSGVPYWAQTAIPAYDVAAAEADMAKSGYGSGFDANIVIPNGDAGLNTIAQAIQQALAPLKIRLTVTPVESTAYFGEYFLTGKFDLTLLKNSSDVPDPDEIVSAWATNNWYVNANSKPEAALAAQAASEPEKTKRAALYAQVLNSYATDMVGLPMFDLTSDYGWRRSTLPHFAVTVLGGYDLISFE